MQGISFVILYALKKSYTFQVHLWITVIYTRLEFAHDFKFWDSYSLNHGTTVPSAIKVFIKFTTLS